MYGALSVVNNTGKVISLRIDGDILFFDVIPGERTKRMPVFAGTRCAQVLNNREKIVADFQFSVPQNTHVILKISGGKA